MRGNYNNPERQEYGMPETQEQGRTAYNNPENVGKKKKKVATIHSSLKKKGMGHLADTVIGLVKSDRDVVLVVSGDTGAGKSTFLTSLQKAYSAKLGIPWSFNNMTWERDELMQWIDGKPDTEKDPLTGLREGQKPEYTAIMADELFHMFYRRNWSDADQIKSIQIFNMCRDRHLFLGGNIPDFMKLDTAFQERVRLWVHISKRGKAYVFKKENNPFNADKWNIKENLASYRYNKNPYDCTNFAFEISFSDWNDKEKDEYLKIRNKKRVVAIEKTAVDTVANVRYQRNIAIRGMKKQGVSNKDIAEMMCLGRNMIEKINKE